MPGESPGRYHSESDQEGFLVLSGECVLVVEGEERRLRQWDYFHCPPGTAHITVGASEEPCAIFMLGARTPGGLTDYVPDPVAAKNGAAVKRTHGHVEGGLRRPRPHVHQRPRALASAALTDSRPTSLGRPRGGPPCQSRHRAVGVVRQLAVDRLQDGADEVLNGLAGMQSAACRHQRRRCRRWRRCARACRR